MALSRIAAMGMGLVGALAGSQGPEFAQQYEQRLGGAIDELAAIVARFDDSAAEAGLDREGALGRLEANPDDLVRRQGESAREAAERLARLERQAERLARSDGLGQVLVLVREADPQIADAAYRAYEPAVPVTVAGALAAGLGFGAFWLLAFGTAKGVKHGGRKGMAYAKARFAKRRAPPGSGEPKDPGAGIAGTGGPKVFRAKESRQDRV
ncbi:DUF2937 family protein [Salinarimonas ramus]|uniref:DUF2937 family protein n=1 Tax=Salinarimonas ramus TaxID=690164 RepID=A0A917V2D5_9HYPH|nr:DUF2937 family protein [Salinarimonas ramus]GGK27333.1 hypothetical protein GCM10011322_12320 [Salinarimonas ramus]